MSQFVEIQFDCLPLRTIGRLDIPLDASPKFRAFCERLKHALDEHGTFNTYYLHNARCIFHLTNQPDQGMLHFSFEGVVTTDDADARTDREHLTVKLERETCDWLKQPIVDWFTETVPRAVMVEFDRYISAGDLRKAVERIEKLQAESDKHGGYLGMYL
ncbi:MAG: hypothetical protein JSS27_06705 [Planctomycetes bacterium]|nr:hypothetical protein [Planctomycetota bacterium]